MTKLIPIFGFILALGAAVAWLESREARAYSAGEASNQLAGARVLLASRDAAEVAAEAEREGRREAEREAESARARGEDLARSAEQRWRARAEQHKAAAEAARAELAEAAAAASPECPAVPACPAICQDACYRFEWKEN
ncbi:MAG: hypothetical protein OXC08_18835 [Thiotrichales bacterium]|nr:hypothetical protein [Thiotrichales bacterium]